MFSAGCATTYFAVQACSHLRRDERTRIHVLLGWILAYWAVANMKDLVQAVPGWYNRQTLDYIMLADGWSAITFACFLFELTMPGWVTRKHVAFLCLPFAGFTLAYLAKPGNTILYLYTAFLSAFGLFILSIGYAKAKKHLEFIKENYSNIDEIDISWIRRVYVVAFLNQSLWLLVSLIGEAFADMLYYLSSILLWQMIVNNCRNLKQIRPSQNGESNDMEMTPERKTYPFADTLESIMTDERLYLNPALSLSDLSSRVGTNRTYLSQYFSNVKRLTFYDYVNALRIEKMSIPLLVEHPEYTLDYIAKQSGFNSLSTFQRAFRKQTGTTPGNFRKKRGS